MKSDQSGIRQGHEHARGQSISFLRFEERAEYHTYWFTQFMFSCGLCFFALLEKGRNTEIGKELRKL